MTARSQSFVAAVSLAALPLSAQGILPLVESGDALPAGTVSFVDRIDVTSDGGWLAHVYCSDTKRQALVRDGAVLVQAGDPVPGIPGAVYDLFGTTDLGAGGHVAIQSSYADLGPKTALHLDGALVGTQGTPVGAPQLPPGTAWHVVDGARVNASGLMLAHGFTGVLGSTAPLLVKLDPSAGFAADAVAWPGQILPGQTQPVDAFFPYAGFVDLNDAGQVLFTPHVATAGFALYLDGALLAQEGAPSPVAGFNWATFAGLDLDNHGGWVVAALLRDAANDPLWTIVRNGAVFAKVGDVLPATAPHALTDLGGALGADDGTLAWVGEWNGRAVLSVDQLPILELGTTQIAGKTVFKLLDFARDDSGRFLAVAVYFDDTTYGAYLIDLTGGATTPVPGCAPSGATLSTAGGASPSIGQTLDLALDGAQAPGALSFAAIASQPASAGPCGVIVPGVGEVLISLAPPNPLVTLPGPTWTGAAVTIPVAVPPVGALVGDTFFAQGLFLDAGGASGEPLRLTTGLALDVGV